MPTTKPAVAERVFRDNAGAEHFALNFALRGSGIVTIRDVAKESGVLCHYSLYCTQQRSSGSLHPQRHQETGRKLRPVGDVIRRYIKAEIPLFAQFEILGKCEIQIFGSHRADVIKIRWRISRNKWVSVKRVARRSIPVQV